MRRVAFFVRRGVLSAILFAGPAAAQGAPGASAPPVSLADAIGMVRVQRTHSAGDRVATFSPDGSRFATVLRRGDLARNVNVYSLMLFDVARAVASAGQLGAPPTTVLSLDFAGDSSDQFATPIAQLTFLPDQRRLAFLGTLRGEPRQVYAVDVLTKQVRPLTRHPTAVRAYALGPDGEVTVYAAVAVDSADSVRRAELRADGASVFDEVAFPDRNAAGGDRAISSAVVVGSRRREVRQYFVQRRGEAAPVQVFDSRRGRPAARVNRYSASGALQVTGTPDDEDDLRRTAELTGDPTGRYALLWPYALTEHPMHPERYRALAAWNNSYVLRMAQPYGLVELATGRITRLLDAPHSLPIAPGAGPPVWAPDGRSVLVHTFLPLEGEDGDTARAKASANGPARWVEVELATRRITPLPIPDGAQPLTWTLKEGVVLSVKDSTSTARTGTAFARLPRAAGGWGAVEFLGDAALAGFNSRYPVATNGRVVVGIKDSLLTPPELAVYDLASRRTTVVTDLNPALRTRQYGRVEKIFWRGPYDTLSFGYLVHPVASVPGRRYPLAIYFKDESRSDTTDHSFIIDGTEQWAGYAVQTLAGDGIAVLIAPPPPSQGAVVATPEEGRRVLAHVESGIAALAARGLIDTTRVGLAGWSRAAYWTNYVLIHSRFRFAAAAQIDGGGREYNDRGRVFTREELAPVWTPLLIDLHGPRTAVGQAPFIDVLHALGKPVEAMYYATMPHSPQTPRHRWRAFTTHRDWFRFWLQDYEDPDRRRSAQYARWRQMRPDVARGPR